MQVKSPHLQNFVVESMHRAEEHDEVIDVTEDLINYHEKLSTVCDLMLLPFMLARSITMS